MPLSIATDETSLRTALSMSSGAVIAIPVFNAADHFLRCLDSVLRHTPSGQDILLIDDAGPDRSAFDEIGRLSTWSHHNVILFSKLVNQGFVKACNDAFEFSGRRDVIILNSDCIVGPEWYDRICAAAHSSTQIATVSTLTNHGTILSVPERNHPGRHLPNDMSVDQAAIRVAQASRRSRPDVPTAVGHCLYVRRRALDIVGGFDPVFHRGYGEEVDFSQRCLKFGLRNVCADDVFVYHYGRASFGESARAEQLGNDRLVEKTHRHYGPMIAATSEERFSTLAAALDTADAALRGLRVGIDARKLSAINVGTQSVIIGSIMGLRDALVESSLTVFIAPDMSPERMGSVGRLGGISWVQTDGNPVETPCVDVIFRPCQVDNWEDLSWLQSVGRRVVINQLDVIAFSNPNYFKSVGEWWGYRDLTRLALLTADGVTTVSNFSYGEIERLDLISDVSRLQVIHHGTRTDLLNEDEGETKPPGFDDSDLPFMLCVGVSYHHKNRRFGIRLLQQMLNDGWDGRLVFVGPHPDFGDSSSSDILEMFGHPELRGRVIDAGPLTESAKHWLYARAALCLYPSTVEGFGLIPFESARFGTPVLFADHGSLGEILPAVANLSDLDLLEASRTALHLMSCEACATEQIQLITQRSASLTWERYGAELQAFFLHTLSKSKNRCAAVTGDRDHAVSSSTLSLHGGRIRPRFHWVVAFAKRHPRLKRVISPDGSRRQKVIRTEVHRIRARQQRRNSALATLR